MSLENHYILDIVHHKQRNFPKVARCLRSRDIKGVNIFTEASNSELKNTHPFYGRLSKFLAKQYAIEIHEPDYEANMKLAREIYEDTLPPHLKDLRKSKFGWMPSVVISEFDRYMKIVCQVRDPVIARQIIDTASIYSIFGSGHIPGVLAILKEKHDINAEVLHLS